MNILCSRCYLQVVERPKQPNRSTAAVLTFLKTPVGRASKLPSRLRPQIPFPAIIGTRNHTTSETYRSGHHHLIRPPAELAAVFISGTKLLLAVQPVLVIVGSGSGNVVLLKPAQVRRNKAVPRSTVCLLTAPAAHRSTTQAGGLRTTIK